MATAKVTPFAVLAQEVPTAQSVTRTELTDLSSESEEQAWQDACPWQDLLSYEADRGVR